MRPDVTFGTLAAGSTEEAIDVAVIGGGQAALAVAYYLRRTGLSWSLFDAEDGPGGAWRHGWDSLRLFSPAQWSSLPGWMMPRGRDEYPTRDEVLAYLAAYEHRYGIGVRRGVLVRGVARSGDGFVLDTTAGAWRARAVVSATGTWRAPVMPVLPGLDAFGGTVLHSAQYRSPAPFAGKRVVVVGGGNSGAQVAADLLPVASTVTWATLAPPCFLPEDVDGRVLFGEASERWQALRGGAAPPPRSLGDVVQVPPVRAARSAGRLRAVPMFTGATAHGVRWPDGRETREDAIVFATGFRPALGHLGPLGIPGPDGRVAVHGTRSLVVPGLWLVGYGDWTGFASATLIGVGRSARATVAEVAESLGASGVAP